MVCRCGDAPTIEESEDHVILPCKICKTYENKCYCVCMDCYIEFFHWLHTSKLGVRVSKDEIEKLLNKYIKKKAWRSFTTKWSFWN